MCCLWPAMYCGSEIDGFAVRENVELCVGRWDEMAGERLDSKAVIAR